MSAASSSHLPFVAAVLDPAVDITQDRILQNSSCGVPFLLLELCLIRMHARHRLSLHLPSIPSLPVHRSQEDIDFFNAFMFQAESSSLFLHCDARVTHRS
jgi:hypothetical protein